MTIENMIADKINEYAELFVSVFNSEPWNDSWTTETACGRIESMMNTTTLTGSQVPNDIKNKLGLQKKDGKYANR